METDPVVQALSDQVECYRRLAKLAAIQHDHVQNSRTEELIAVLQSRQLVLAKVEEQEKVISSVKKRWTEYAASLSAGLRTRADALMTEARQLLEQITAADRRDVMVLQQRKLNIGRKISQTSNARQVNRNYASAAYGTAKPRMDLQM